MCRISPGWRGSPPHPIHWDVSSWVYTSFIPLRLPPPPLSRMRLAPPPSQFNHPPLHPPLTFVLPPQRTQHLTFIPSTNSESISYIRPPNPKWNTETLAPSHSDSIVMCTCSYQTRQCQEHQCNRRRIWRGSTGWPGPQCAQTDEGRGPWPGHPWHSLPGLASGVHWMGGGGGGEGEGGLRGSTYCSTQARWIQSYM